MTREVLDEVSTLLHGVYNTDTLMSAMGLLLNLDDKSGLLELHRYVQDPAVLARMVQYILKEGDPDARSLLDRGHSV